MILLFPLLIWFQEVNGEFLKTKKVFQTKNTKCVASRSDLLTKETWMDC
jgi:hypothetical protein